MVTPSFPRAAGRRSWSAYLLLSLVANAAGVYAAGLGAPPRAVIEVPVLKVNFSAVAAPPPAIQRAASAVAVPPPPAATPLPIETTADAPVSIAPPRQSPDPAPRQTPGPTASAREPVTDASAPPAHEPLPTPQRRPQRATPVAPSPDLPPREQVRTTEVARASQPRKSFNADTGDQAATVVHNANYRRRTPPVYPRRAVELGQQGVVLLHAEVLPDGHPRELKVVQSSGHRLLDVAAMAAVKTWQFEPSSVDGAPVTSWVRVPVRFVIQQ